MSHVKFYTTTKSKADNPSQAPINDGQFLVVTDTKQLMYDHGSTRIAFEDVGALRNPGGGSAGQVLIKTVNGVEWDNYIGLSIVDGKIAQTITQEDS